MKMKLGSSYDEKVKESWHIVFGVIHKISVEEAAKFKGK